MTNSGFPPVTTSLKQLKFCLFFKLTDDTCVIYVLFVVIDNSVEDSVRNGEAGAHQPHEDNYKKADVFFTCSDKSFLHLERDF